MMLDLPKSLSFTVNINLTNQDVSFSFSTIDPTRSLSDSQVDLLNTACQEAIAGLVGYGLTEILKKQHIGDAIEARMSQMSQFSGLGWKEPDGWTDFDKRAPE